MKQGLNLQVKGTKLQGKCRSLQTECNLYKLHPGYCVLSFFALMFCAPRQDFGIIFPNQRNLMWVKCTFITLHSALCFALKVLCITMIWKPQV